MIVDPQVVQYVLDLTPLPHPVLREMEEEAKRHDIPIINREAMQLIRVLLMAKGEVRHILEIGTSIGYSTLCLAFAAPRAHVDTIEHDERWVKRARSYIAQAGLEKRVTVHQEDALTSAPRFNKEYDVIFIDATKRHYRHLFEQYSPKLRENGLMITDNILFKGRVAGHPAENRRLALTAEMIDQFNRWLFAHDQFETSFVPIGDGLAISVKKGKINPSQS